ncbi:MAG: phage tail protein [Lachnospiraceae bacterium]|nr:phage tail protein [Lachnospiraceae bacterium]MBD5509989.1 phage tail protein [Lachnospiraceae bacterium]
MAAVYKTKSGDTWDKIAREAYGNETDMSFLMKCNQRLLDYFVFPAGIEVVIQDKPEENGNLPDWRQ